MSDTPRTDAIYKESSHCFQNQEMVFASFARQLERELAEAKNDAERLLFLMNQSGDFYCRGYGYQMTGKLREYIDAAMKEGK
jgi:hypothetical protein